MIERVEVRSLVKELSETVLLLGVAAFTLAAYVGIALFFVRTIAER